MIFEADGSDHSYDGVSMLGMVNALRTGDVVLDMIIAMCAPIILRVLFAWLGKLDDVSEWEIWTWLFEKKPIEHERFISHTTSTNSYGDRSNIDEDVHNSILLKAIKLYLHKVVKLDLKSAYLDLTGTEDENYDRYFESGNDDDEDRPQRTLAGQLSRFAIINRLPNDEWHELGTFGKGIVRLRIEQNRHEESDGKEGSSSKARNIENTTFHFLSPEKGSIDCFIDTAYEWYLNELRKTEDNSRYYYEMKIPEKFGKVGEETSGSEGIKYKRYKLSDEKTFESLFFREKPNLLALVNHFRAKTGKYSIKGYPHKVRKGLNSISFVHRCNQMYLT